jgi:hypothetical protein
MKTLEKKIRLRFMPYATPYGKNVFLFQRAARRNGLPAGPSGACPSIFAEELGLAGLYFWQSFLALTVKFFATQTSNAINMIQQLCDNEPKVLKENVLS